MAFAVGISVCATMYIVERQPDGIYENFYYYINDDNMLTVSAYSYEESVEFPSEIDGRLVSTIAAPIYATGNKNLKSVVIPEGIIAIGSGVFKDTLVEKIDFPETLITIGANAFKNSTITEVVLPDSVTNVYEHAFENCNRLTTFHCGKNMSGVGEAAFKNCVALTDVYLNDDIENISTSAFENCNRLKELFVPEGLVSLGTDAFSGCSQLTVRFGREEHPGFWSGWSTTYGSVTEEWGAKR